MIVALRNQKGGVGKTMLALHLAGQWPRQGKRITLIDADPEGSALDWSGQRACRRFDRLLCVIDPPHDPLRREAPELPGHSDYILVDGPPRVAPLLRSALLAADLARIPAQPSPFDSWASVEMPALIAETRVFRPALSARFVLNRCPARTITARDAAQRLAEHDPLGLTARVSQRVRVTDAARAGQLSAAQSSNGATAREIATLGSETERMSS